ncbi:MAG: GNAT family N-acetyltransferase [Candidatus Bathyarchaeota archaeon]|nr:GNAT family N-acetyltransferase [Candidatus Bathyarchaeota archaeon]
MAFEKPLDEKNPMYVENLSDKKEWEEFMETCPNATFYHTPQWRQVLEHTFTRPLYLAVRNKNGKLVAVCPGFILESGIVKMYHSTPFSDYSGPVIANDCYASAAQALLSHLQNYCVREGIAYAKTCLMENDSKRIWQYATKYVDPNVGVVEIDLNECSSAFIWNSVFSARMRRDLRQVEKKGFQVRQATTKSDFNAFYRLYALNMQSIGGAPFPYAFMENMWRLLYPVNMRIWLIGKEKPVAGPAVFKYGRGTYGAYVGLDRAGSGRFAVVPYLMYHELKKAEEEGYKLVSLGSTPRDPNGAHYLQKIRLGGSYRNQITTWLPFNSTGHMLVLGRNRAVTAWKNIRKYLPQDINQALEKRLAIF